MEIHFVLQCSTYFSYIIIYLFLALVKHFIALFSPRHLAVTLTPLNKIHLALGAVDTDFSFSSGNPYLLAAAGTLVDVELAGLGYLEFQVLPAFLNTEFQIQILLVLLEPFADIL